MHNPDLPVPAPVPRRPGGTVIVELVRLVVVVLATAVAFEVSSAVDPIGGLDASRETWLLTLTALGAGTGYVAGGVLGRFAVGRIDAAEQRLRVLSAGELLAGVLGAGCGVALAAALVWPLLLFGATVLTVAIAALVGIVLAATGMRLGVARGGDLLRFVGASGRLPLSTPAHGPSAKVVDTSALVDGRLLDVCRAGFCEGTLVVPRVVLHELQGLADAGEDQRRARGRRGLDVLAALNRSAGIALEVTEVDYPEISAVDAKLVAMARDRRAGLVTVDGNLARVAELQGVTVLNLHALADTLRPPVLPGDRLTVRVLKPGRESGQGVGYLADGTMVVVEGGRGRQGEDVPAEVTSILSNGNGRMVFATVADAADAGAAGGPRAAAGVA